MTGPRTRRKAPALDGILETALYVDDLDIARAFYADTMAFAEILSDARMAAFAVGDDRVLLLFKRGASAVEAHLPGGIIPPHDGSGPIHIAFAVTARSLAAWERHLAAAGIEIESTVDWPDKRGRSLYFRDPDGHLLELAPRRLWKHM